MIIYLSLPSSRIDDKGRTWPDEGCLLPYDPRGYGGLVFFVTQSDFLRVKVECIGNVEHVFRKNGQRRRSLRKKRMKPLTMS